MKNDRKPSGSDVFSESSDSQERSDSGVVVSLREALIYISVTFGLTVLLMLIALPSDFGINFPITSQSKAKQIFFKLTEDYELISKSLTPISAAKYVLTYANIFILVFAASAAALVILSLRRYVLYRSKSPLARSKDITSKSDTVVIGSWRVIEFFISAAIIISMLYIIIFQPSFLLLDTTSATRQLGAAYSVVLLFPVVFLFITIFVLRCISQFLSLIEKSTSSRR